MQKCDTCEELIAPEARVCPKCGANRYRKITPLFILINVVQSVFYVMVIGVLIVLINKDFHDKFITDAIYYSAMAIILILLTYKDYNTKLSE